MLHCIPTPKSAPLQPKLAHQCLQIHKTNAHATCSIKFPTKTCDFILLHPTLTSTLLIAIAAKLHNFSSANFLEQDTFLGQAFPTKHPLGHALLRPRSSLASILATLSPGQAPHDQASPRPSSSLPCFPLTSTPTTCFPGQHPWPRSPSSGQHLQPRFPSTSTPAHALHLPATTPGYASLWPALSATLSS